MTGWSVYECLNGQICGGLVCLWLLEWTDIWLFNLFMNDCLSVYECLNGLMYDWSVCLWMNGLSDGLSICLWLWMDWYMTGWSVYECLNDLIHDWLICYLRLDCLVAESEAGDATDQHPACRGWRWWVLRYSGGIIRIAESLLWQPKLIYCCIIISWSVLWKDWIVVLKVKVTLLGQSVLNVCQSCIFCTTDTCGIKLAVLVYCHLPQTQWEPYMQI